MENVTLRLLLLLAVAVAATVFTFHAALKHGGIGRKHVVISSALCLLGLLGLIPAVRDRIGAIRYPEAGTAGTLLVLFVAVSSLLLSMALIGRKRLAAIARDTVERVRIALEERRNPELRRRNACVRKYERVLQVLHGDDPSGNADLRSWYHDEDVSEFIRSLSDEDIAVLSEFLVMHLLEGKSPPDVFVFFLKGERRRASRDEREMRGHLVRLSTVAARLRQENAA